VSAGLTPPGGGLLIVRRRLLLARVLGFPIIENGVCSRFAPERLSG